MQLRIGAPVLDRAHARHRIHDPDERSERVALSARERILEQDQRQVGNIGDALEIIDCHLRALAEGVDPGGEHEQGGRAARVRHFREAHRFERAFAVDAVDDGQARADFILGEREHALLLVETAEATSEACALMVTAEMPCTAAMSRRCER